MSSVRITRKRELMITKAIRLSFASEDPVQPADQSREDRVRSGSHDVSQPGRGAGIGLADPESEVRDPRRDEHGERKAYEHGEKYLYPRHLLPAHEGKRRHRSSKGRHRGVNHPVERALIHVNALLAACPTPTVQHDEYDEGRAA